MTSLDELTTSSPADVGRDHRHHRDVVVIGASAGGVEALERLVADLPAEFPATLLIALHVTASGPSMLAQILDRSGPLPATPAENGQRIERGQILVAPPDRHLLVQGDVVTLSWGPRENGHRPAIDALFRSAARSLGPRVIGVVLSGMLDDGAAGLRLIGARGGRTIVQDPDEAAYPAMPRSAIGAASPDHVAPLGSMAKILFELVEKPVGPDEGGREGEAGPVGIAPQPDEDDPEAADPEGGYTPALAPGAEPAAITCPDCGGALWVGEEAGLVR